MVSRAKEEYFRQTRKGILLERAWVGYLTAEKFSGLPRWEVVCSCWANNIEERW